ncbi:dTMP kinase [Erythrobacter litoralis]|uniref:dTMP kinase n=1 Tax=Erythrobacter litoralis TaxID=39960 RepID=UPI0024353D3C|nr:dTMP kinase [Erythrobacter litoralis]MDG6078183.1 dTMP kinase [Erythrobacter litoralis]
MMHGKFIALEGGEGAGKSTQARLLASALRECGIEVDATREPGGTPGAEAIRQLILDPPGEGWGAPSEALLFAAARADHVEKRIRPALARGTWIVSDRFLDSSRAYQGFALSIGDEAVRTLHKIGSQDLLPDLTIVLAAEEATSSLRLRQRDGDTSDAIGGRGREYHEAVNRAFLNFAEREPSRFAVISGEGGVEGVHRRVMDAVLPLIDAFKL